MREDIRPLISFRSFEKEDLNFILSTWLKGLYHGNSWFKQIDPDRFWKVYQDVVLNLLNNPSTEVKVAALKDEPSVILGYAVLAPNTIHWIFVKKSWRKLGIGKSLAPEDANICTHLTAVGRSLKPKNMKFDPFF